MKNLDARMNTRTDHELPNNEKLKRAVGFEMLGGRGASATGIRPGDLLDGALRDSAVGDSDA